MHRDFATVLEAWEGKGAFIGRDPQTETWFFVAMHDDRLGPATGGTRMRIYADAADGLEDATRLARGMSFKWAGIGLPFGGGKAVLAIPRPMEGEERRGLLERFAGVLNLLGGAFQTGEDLGTTPEDMAVLAAHSDYVVGGGNGPNDPGPFTALGVFEGIRSALRSKEGNDSLEGRSVLIQGAGDVGAPLARLIAKAGARVLIADLDRARAERVAREVDGKLVSADEVYDTPCDVYAPCAVGATLNADTIPRLACSVVAGSANNQLLVDADADRLHERGILYAPDYVVNGGGALAFGLMQHGIRDVAELERRVEGIGSALDEIFHEARQEGVTPAQASDRRVQRILEQGLT